MRQLTSHKVHGLNQELTILVADKPGHGNACHSYTITSKYDNDTIPRTMATIEFQNGPLNEHGLNGISIESLLAIVQDRLECFQSGEYACRENALALTHVQDALHWLHHRTRQRIERGVEGTTTK